MILCIVCLLLHGATGTSSEMAPAEDEDGAAGDGAAGDGAARDGTGTLTGGGTTRGGGGSTLMTP